MKISQHIFFTVLIGMSFLFSDYTKAPKKNFSFQKEKKDGVIKPEENNDLKIELLNLETRFKSDYDMIKNNYKDQITSLKNMQKSEVQSLKQNYKERRRAIYKKYGVSPVGVLCRGHPNRSLTTSCRYKWYVINHTLNDAFILLPNRAKSAISLKIRTECVLGSTKC